MVTARYLEHLSDGDLAFLAAGAEAGGADIGHLRARPDLVARLLADRGVFERMFGARAGSDPLLAASPFLAFAVMVERCADELGRAAFVEEWVAPRRRLPVFDVGELRGFLDDRGHRIFLAELLASYTHVASGAVMVRSRGRWRRQRFSELDPVRLASLLEMVPEEDRPGIYRRLGDLALFLTGIFPDHSAAWTMSPVEAARLRRAGAIADDADELRAGEGLGLLEQLGERCYRRAAASARPQTHALRAVHTVAERFGAARRILNFVADRYLFRFRSRWFPGMG